MSIDIEKVISTILRDTAKPVNKNDLLEFISNNTKELQEVSSLVFLPSATGYILDEDGKDLYAGGGGD